MKRWALIGVVTACWLFHVLPGTASARPLGEQCTDPGCTSVMPAPTPAGVLPAQACAQALGESTSTAVRDHDGFCYVPARCPALPAKISLSRAALAHLQLNRLLHVGGNTPTTMQVMLSMPEEQDRRAFIGLPDQLRPGFLISRFPALTDQQVGVHWLSIDEAISECQGCGGCTVPFPPPRSTPGTLAATTTSP